MDPKLFILAMFLMVGVVIAFISLPLIWGAVGPNPWYGLRVKATLDDPRVWYSANRYAALWMFGAAVVFIVTAATVYFLFPKLGIAPYALTCAAALFVGLAIGLVQSLRHISRIRRGGKAD
jgi:hypothetical protein